LPRFCGLFSQLGYTGQSCNVVPTKAVHIFVPSQHLIQKVLHFVCEFRASRSLGNPWIPGRATQDCDPGLLARPLKKRSNPMMLQRWFFTVLLLVTLPASLAAQERYLVAYAGFAGFQAPVWAPKDLGLMAKYGFNGDVVLVP